MSELLIARIDAFTKAGRYVPRGAPVNASEVDYDADDENSAFISAPSGVGEGGAVEMSAIAPTGPNAQNPQQIAAGTVQTEAGYVDRGVRVVGEVTKPEKERFVEIIDDGDDTQAQVEEALADADAETGAADGANLNNDDDDLVAGTVAEVTAGLADKDEAELQRLRAAEEDREKPRTGVISAIDKELASR